MILVNVILDLVKYHIIYLDIDDLIMNEWIIE